MCVVCLGDLHMLGRHFLPPSHTSADTHYLSAHFRRRQKFWELANQDRKTGYSQQQSSQVRYLPPGSLTPHQYSRDKKGCVPE